MVRLLGAELVIIAAGLVRGFVKDCSTPLQYYTGNFICRVCSVNKINFSAEKQM